MKAHVARRAIVIALCGASLIPAAAWGKDTNDDSSLVEDETGASEQVASAAADQQAEPLAEDGGIVVTAQRRSESMQKVPIAMDVVGAAALSTRPMDTKALAALVPGLEVHTSTGAAALYLRGVGFSSAQAGTESPVGLYVDGIYQPTAQANVFALNSIERVEVLKGPQGTLFGRNTSAGVVNLVTRDPSENGEIEGQFGYGNYNTISGNLYATTGLGGGFSANIAVNGLKQHDGWGRDLTLDREIYNQENISVRSKLKWEDNGGLTEVVLSGGYAGWKQNFGALATIPGYTGRDGSGNAGFYNVLLNLFPSLTGKKWDGYIKASHDFGAFSLINITSYQDVKLDMVLDLDHVAIPFIDQYQKLTDKTFSNELQFVSPDSSPIKWIVGLYFFNDDAFTDFRQYGDFAASRGGGVVTLTDLDTRSRAAYGQITFPVLDSTRLTLGGRYTFDKRTVDATVTPLAGTPTAPQQEKSWKRFTGRVAIDHDFTPDILGYVSYNRGFKAGGFSINGPANPVVGPETLNAYEIGLKSQLFDRAVRLNLAGFYYDYTDMQFRGAVGNVQLLLNAKAAEVYGLDVDYAVRFSNHFSINGGAELLHARFTDFKNAVVAIQNGTGVPSIGVQDVSGNRLPQSPDVSLTFGATYRTDLSFGEIMLTADAKYTGEMTWDPDNFIKSPSKVVANGSIKWTSPDEHLDVSVYGDNIFDKHYFFYAGATSSGNTYSPAPPRTYGVRVGFHF